MADEKTERLTEILADEDANHQLQRDALTHRCAAQHIPDRIERRCPESMARHVQCHCRRRSVRPRVSVLVLLC